MSDPVYVFGVVDARSSDVAIEPLVVRLPEVRPVVGPEQEQPTARARRSG